MDAVEVISIVSGLIGVISFVFAVWVWLRTDVKVRELTGTLRAVYDISGSVLWETHFQAAEDLHTQLRQTERALGLVSSIRTLAAKYTDVSPDFRQTELGALIERGVIWSNKMIWNIEGSQEVQEVWVVTPDLEPDLSEKAIGGLVYKNLQEGKRYVYFYPTNLPNAEENLARLFNNIGVSRSRRRLAPKVSLVPVLAQKYPSLFSRGNTMLYFRDDPSACQADVFQEVVFTKVSVRGLFWQEHDKLVGDDIRRFLQQELHDWMDQKG